LKNGVREGEGEGCGFFDGFGSERRVTRGQEG
jgi:hypothetical protein